MTEQERRIARAIIDEARRRRLQVEAEVDRERSRTYIDLGLDPRPCAYNKCGETFEPGARNQIYCCRSHGLAAWRNSTPERREHWRDLKREQRRRQHERQKAARTSCTTTADVKGSLA